MYDHFVFIADNKKRRWSAFVCSRRNHCLVFRRYLVFDKNKCKIIYNPQATPVLDIMLSAISEPIHSARYRRVVKCTLAYKSLASKASYLFIVFRRHFHQQLLEWHVTFLDLIHFLFSVSDTRLVSFGSFLFLLFFLNVNVGARTKESEPQEVVQVHNLERNRKIWQDILERQHIFVFTSSIPRQFVHNDVPSNDF